MAMTAAPAWGRYAVGSRIDHFAWWCAEHCRHAVGPFAGSALDLEDWQHEFFGEGLATDERDLPYWSTVCLIVPRKNGKTTATSAIGAYEADEEDGTPIVGLAATSDEQASELFDAISAFIAASPYLSQRFHVRDYEGEIARTDAGGYVRRMRMDWRRLHGKNLAKLIADEIHAWSTLNLRRCWEALTTGDGARPGFQTWAITTEGEPDEIGESILSALVQVNERFGEVERRPGLTISRNHEARVLIYRYSAPMPAADPRPVRDAYRAWSEAKAEGRENAEVLHRQYESAVRRCVEAVKLANPASWVTPEYLARKAVDPKISPSAFLRYHACVAAESDDRPIPPQAWDACAVPGLVIPAGTCVHLAVAFSERMDSGCLAAVGPAADGVRAVAFTLIEAAGDVTSCHEQAMAAVREAAREWQHACLAYNPLHFTAPAETLRAEGIVLYRGPTTTRDGFSEMDTYMIPASQRLVESIERRQLVHDGDTAIRQQMVLAERKAAKDAWRIVRPKRPTGDGEPRRAEAAIALAMALAAAEQDTATPFLI